MTSLKQTHHLLPSYHHHHQHHHRHHHCHPAPQNPYSNPPTFTFHFPFRPGDELWRGLPTRGSKVNLLSNSLTSRLRTSARHRAMIWSSGATGEPGDSVSTLGGTGEVRNRNNRASSKRDSTASLRPFVFKAAARTRTGEKQAVESSTHVHGDARFPGVLADRLVTSPVADEADHLGDSVTGDNNDDFDAAPRSHVVDTSCFQEDHTKRLPRSVQSLKQRGEASDLVHLKDKQVAGPGPALIHAGDISSPGYTKDKCFHRRSQAAEASGCEDDEDNTIDRTSLAIDQSGTTADTTLSNTAPSQVMWEKRKSDTTQADKPTTRRRGENPPGSNLHQRQAVTMTTRPKSSNSATSSTGWTRGQGGQDTRLVRSLKDPTVPNSQVDLTEGRAQTKKGVRIVWKDLQPEDKHQDPSCPYRLKSASAVSSDGAATRSRKVRLTPANGHVPVIGVTWKLPSSKTGRPPAPFCEGED